MEKAAGGGPNRSGSGRLSGSGSSFSSCLCPSRSWCLQPDGVTLQGLDVYALVGVSFLVLQRFKVPIYLIIPVGAVIGMVWTLL